MAVKPGLICKLTLPCPYPTHSYSSIIYNRYVQSYHNFIRRSKDTAKLCQTCTRSALITTVRLFLLYASVVWSKEIAVHNVCFGSRSKSWWWNEWIWTRGCLARKAVVFSWVGRGFVAVFGVENLDNSTGLLWPLEVLSQHIAGGGRAKVFRFSHVPSESETCHFAFGVSSASCTICKSGHWGSLTGCYLHWPDP